MTVLGMKSISKAHFQSRIFTKQFHYSFDNAFTKTHAREPPHAATGGLGAAPLGTRENTIFVKKIEVLQKETILFRIPEFLRLSAM